MDVFQKTGSRPHEFHRNLIGHRVNLSKPRFDAIHPATTDRLGEYKHGHQASPSHSLRRLLRGVIVRNHIRFRSAHLALHAVR
jgi:hypothetical protein